MDDNSASLRQTLVDALGKARHIKTPAVRDAFLAVPRELFVADHARRGGLEAVYKDEPIVVKTDAKGMAISSSSQPAIMAIMLEALRLEHGHRVLEVGAGTGYNAALLSHIVGNEGAVTAIDIDAELVTRAKAALRAGGFRARVRAGDGRDGLGKHAPYDRIVVTASTDVIPRAWVDQLRSGGLLEVPFRLLEGFGALQSVVVFEATRDGLRSIDANPGSFMGLRTSADDHAPMEGHRVIVAYEAKGSRAHVHASVSGSPPARAGRDGRRGLLRLLLQEPRARDVAGKNQSSALQSFLTLAIPRASLVQYQSGKSFGVGIVSPDFRGVAVAACSAKGGTSLRCFGDESAERTMDALLAEWEALENARELEITVSYGARPKAWRVLARGDSYVAVDWRAKV